MKFPWSLKKILIIAGALLLAGGIYIYNTINLANDPHLAVSYRLRALCAGIYEYHAMTGKWPAKAAELAGTPMSMQLGYWDYDIRSGHVVVVWPRDYQPNPEDNGDRLLAYYTAGLISQFGRQWVCWGDLRTEYLPSARLQEALKKEAERGKE